MSKRSDLKENQLASRLERALRWAVDRRQAVLTSLGILLGFALLLSVFVIRRNQQREVHWTQISQAQALLRQGRRDDARALLRQVADASGSAAAGLYAEYFLGEVHLSEEKFSEAEANYRTIVDQARGAEIRPLALANLGHAIERQNNFADAAATYRRFLDEYPEHFMAPRIQLGLGRAYLLSGEADAANETLGQLVDLYPTSVWAENARRLLDKNNSR